MKTFFAWSILLLILGVSGCNEQAPAPATTEPAVTPESVAPEESPATEAATDIDEARSSAWEPDETSE